MSNSISQSDKRTQRVKKYIQANQVWCYLKVNNPTSSFIELKSSNSGWYVNDTPTNINDIDELFETVTINNISLLKMIKSGDLSIPDEWLAVEAHLSLIFLRTSYPEIDINISQIHVCHEMTAKYTIKTNFGSYSFGAKVYPFLGEVDMNALEIISDFLIEKSFFGSESPSLKETIISWLYYEFILGRKRGFGL